MNIVAKAQDNAGDIYAEAQQINEKRAAEECTYGEAGVQEAKEVGADN